MKLYQRLLVGAAGLLFLLTGCGPAELITWSPDGQYAIVAGNDALRLVDRTGNILTTLDGAVSSGEPTPVWLPDSHRIVQVFARPAGSWKVFADLLGSERAEAAKRASEALTNLVNTYHGKWKEFGDSEPVQGWVREISAANVRLDSVVYYLQQTRHQFLEHLLNLLGEKDENELMKLAGTVYELRVRAVVRMAADSRLLFRSPDPIVWHGPSPNGNAVAFITEHPNQYLLSLAPADGSSRAVLVDTGAMQADWSPDGQDLFYAKTTAAKAALDESLQLGAITRRHVCTPPGEILPKFEVAADLAGVLMSSKGATRLACLSSDRILFVTAPVLLPSTAKDLLRQPRMFVLRTGEEPTIDSVVEEAAISLLPNRPDRFALSPDRKKVAIPGDQGEVALVDLVTGIVTPVQGPLEVYKRDNKEPATPIVPAWRSVGELCYVVPPGHSSGSATRCELVVASPDGTKKALSKSWPDAMVKNFLGNRIR